MSYLIAVIVFCGSIFKGKRKGRHHLVKIKNFKFKLNLKFFLFL